MTDGDAIKLWIENGRPYQRRMFRFHGYDAIAVDVDHGDFIEAVGHMSGGFGYACILPDGTLAGIPYDRLEQVDLTEMN